ncbi:hypothetical protein HCJ93_24670 [Streptomyces sp. SBST2-5]|uniref:ABC transporter permease n=1 Tax=Streptomyces composti TaxID=2720025 RepID=A0ABX1AD46_9ACTN|nr:hypothetical protein [Streptomyces composti]NJP53172.1 hypothetical protein [Streptomyces composti]
MSRGSREALVRRMLEEDSPAAVPPGLHTEAVRLGARVLRRRTVARWVMWVLLLAAAVAFTVWAATVQPWVEPPSETTPPLTGW